MLRLLVAILVLAPSVSLADFLDANGNPCRVRPGAVCYHEYTASATDSNVITTKWYSDICFNPNVAVDNSNLADDAQIKIRQSMDKVLTASVLTFNVVLGITLTGVATADLSCIYGLPPGSYYTEATVAPAGGETAVVRLQIYNRSTR